MSTRAVMPSRQKVLRRYMNSTTGTLRACFRLDDRRSHQVRKCRRTMSDCHARQAHVMSNVRWHVRIFRHYPSANVHARTAT